MIEELGAAGAAAVLRKRTKLLGFTMSCDDLTGSLLRSLAATKPGGRLLELGTGVGVGSSYLLEGMAADATLDTVDVDPDLTAVAREILGNDPRLSVHTEDAFAFLERMAGTTYDLIFADTWAGKLERAELALDMLAPGGIYLADDMQNAYRVPDPVPGVEPEVLQRIPGQWRDLMALLETRSDLVVTTLDWSTGILIATRRSN
ncbi:MAG TPA: class I SAM-dependent methyltransferase [Trueperaceae bacterium]